MFKQSKLPNYFDKKFGKRCHNPTLFFPSQPSSLFIFPLIIPQVIANIFLGLGVEANSYVTVNNLDSHFN